jgi:hypothetical protein
VLVSENGTGTGDDQIVEGRGFIRKAQVESKVIYGDCNLKIFPSEPLITQYNTNVQILATNYESEH